MERWHRGRANRKSPLSLIFCCAIGLGWAGTAGAQGPAENPNRPAEVAYQRGDFERALELTEQRLRAEPEDHVAFYLRGSAKVELGLRARNPKQIREGITDAREAIRLKGQNYVVYYLPYLYGMTNLTLVESRDDHAAVAVQVADQLLEQDDLSGTNRGNLFYQKGLALAALEKLDEAITAFNQATRVNPDLLAAYTASADVAARSGRLKDAMETFDQTIRIFPENPLVYNNRGMFLQQQDRPEDAVADFTKAIELKPDYFYAYTNRGYSRLQTGQADAAASDFTASLRINPRQPMAYGLRGTSKLFLGDLAGAVEDHRAAVRLVPSNPVAHADLGFAQFFAGDADAARSSFETAYKLDPDAKYLLPWMAEATRVMGESPDPSQAPYAAILEREPKERDWVDVLVAFQLGQLSNEQLLASIAQDSEMKLPQSAEANYFVGRRKLREGKPEEAREHFRQAVETEERGLSAYRGAFLELRK